MPSTAIADIEYEHHRALLTVTFVTGKVYEYYDVPITVAADFHAASSRGAFFNQHIRDAYRFREITRR